jgi:hypothetical protein
MIGTYNKPIEYLLPSDVYNKHIYCVKCECKCIYCNTIKAGSINLNVCAHCMTGHFWLFADSFVARRWQAGALFGSSDLWRKKWKRADAETWLSRPLINSISSAQSEKNLCWCSTWLCSCVMSREYNAIRRRTMHQNVARHVNYIFGPTWCLCYSRYSSGGQVKNAAFCSHYTRLLLSIINCVSIGHHFWSLVLNNRILFAVFGWEGSNDSFIIRQTFYLKDNDFELLRKWKFPGHWVA